MVQGEALLKSSRRLDGPQGPQGRSVFIPQSAIGIPHFECPDFRGTRCSTPPPLVEFIKSAKVDWMPKIVRAKPWVEVKVDVPASWVEGVSNFLIELGSPGVIQEDDSRGVKRKRETVLAYFPDPSSFPNRRKKIRHYLSDLSVSGEKFIFQWRGIREEKWAESWKVHFKPVHASSRIVIKPPWEEYGGKKGEMIITIDPGMAFGTGTHPTTQMCLQALEELIPVFAHPPSVLDFGTGSGILAIAAEKLGADRILALDVDPVAIQCARKNAAANQLNGGIEFRIHSAGNLRQVSDLVVANLLPQELLQAASFLARRISPQGFLVVSGILKGQKKEMASTFIERGLSIESSKEKKGWVCLVLKKHRA
jgi:ribosomal protein L11 methyltransferase